MEKNVKNVQRTFLDTDALKNVTVKKMKGTFNRNGLAIIYLLVISNKLCMYARRTMQYVCTLYVYRNNKMSKD